ncbi:hypothetical protein ACH4JS_02365 [Streptomyces sp. NPDC017638]|uniref:hypothetical protein n=1 Tax=Streptomyces sp. NPDC017638 TaxID=3365004 RepID=UPI003789CF44
MIKKLACASALAATLLAAAPAAEAADAARLPAPDATVPGSALLRGLLGSLEAGNPVTSLTTLLPEGVRGR